MNEPKIYYAEELCQNMLELSDLHMLWKVDLEKHSEHEYYLACNEALNRLSAHYHTELGCCGRSGRHVCMPDTIANRRNYRHIVAAVEREQNRIIKQFS